MKNRSKAWTKHRTHLEAKESKIKEELETVSEDFEGQVKRIATISLISGAAVLGAYGLYRLLRSKSPEEDEPLRTSAPERQQPVQEVKLKKPSLSVKKLIMERLAIVALKFIGAQLTVFLSKKFGLEESDESSED